MFTIIDEHPHYEISLTGVVRSRQRKINCRNRWGPITKILQSRILKPWLAGAGYEAVCLGARKKAYVHQLVAEAYCEKPPGATQVNHIDGNKANNSFTNLEWVTASENIRHSTHVLGKRGGQFQKGQNRHE